MVVVVDHISLGDPFMFSMNRPIIFYVQFCCAMIYELFGLEEAMFIK